MARWLHRDSRVGTTSKKPCHLGSSGTDSRHGVEKVTGETERTMGWRQHLYQLVILAVFVGYLTTIQGV